MTRFCWYSNSFEPSIFSVFFNFMSLSDSFEGEAELGTLVLSWPGDTSAFLPQAEQRMPFVSSPVSCLSK
mgnify:CR=1 FL=1